MGHLVKVSALVAVAAVTATSACADDTTFVEFRYANVEGGETDNQFDATSPRFTDLQYGDGPAYTIGVGREIGRWRLTADITRTELEAKVSERPGGYRFRTSDSYWMTLFGATYAVVDTDRIDVRLGVGGGFVNREARLVQETPTPQRTGRVDELSFGLYGEAGVDLRLSEKIDLVFDVRDVRHNDDLDTSSGLVQAGIRYHFR